MKIRRVTEYFDELQGVYKCVQTLSFVFDVSFQSQLKLRKKLRNEVVRIRAKTFMPIIFFIRKVYAIYLKDPTFVVEIGLAYYDNLVLSTRLIM